MDYKTFLEISAKRRETIKQLRKKKWTWVAIARTYNITPQRAQQLGKQK